MLTCRRTRRRVSWEGMRHTTPESALRSKQRHSKRFVKWCTIFLELLAHRALESAYFVVARS
jgi:hypothetical protein